MHTMQPSVVIKQLTTYHRRFCRWTRLKPALQQWARDIWKAALVSDMAARNRHAIMFVWRSLSFMCKSLDNKIIWTTAAGSR